MFATIPDAIREWAYVAGADAVDSQWILSNYDTWTCNPHYHGPEQPHPEDDSNERLQEELAVMASAPDVEPTAPEAYKTLEEDDLPF